MRNTVADMGENFGNRSIGLLLVVAVVAWMEGNVDAQVALSLAELTEKVPERCKSPAGDIVVGCYAELQSAADHFGIGFPPRKQDLEKAGITPEKVDEYLAQMPAVSDGCCLSACKLTETKCLCNASCSTAMHTIFINELVFSKVYRKIADTCSFAAVAHKLGNSCNDLTPTKCGAQTTTGEDVEINSNSGG